MDPFDIDPLGGFNPFPGLPQGGGARRRKAMYPALTDEVAAPLTDRLLEGSTSLLHSLGGTLDKAFGARAIRGYLAGKPQELKSIIPFSDTLGITNPGDSVSMDDLLVQKGLVNPNNPDTWEFRDFAVPALEIAADPGTYLSFGAKTLAGQAASKLGKLPAGLKPGIRGFDALAPELRAAGKSAEEISHLGKSGLNIADDATTAAISAAKGSPALKNEPLRGLLGIGLPFSEPSVVLGTGKGSQFAAGLADTVGNGIKYAHGVRQLRSLFSTDAGRASNKLAQQAHELGAVPVMDAVQSGTRLAEYGMREKFGKVMQALAGHTGSESEALHLLRSAAEGAAAGTNPAEFLRTSGERFARSVQPFGSNPANIANIQHILQTHWGDLTGIGHDIKGFGEDVLGRARGLGINQKDLEDQFSDYVSRRYIGSKPGVQAGNDFFPTKTGANISRKDALRDVPGGTTAINSWAMDPRLSGAARLPDADVHQVVLQDILNNLTGAGHALTPDVIKSATSKADELTGLLGSIGPEHAAKGLPYFDPNIFQDVSLRGNRAAKVEGSATAFYDAINRGARPLAELKEPVNIKDVLSRAGLTNHKLYGAVDPATDAAIRALGFVDAEDARKALALAAQGDAGAITRTAGLSPAIKDAVEAHGLQGAWEKGYEALARHQPFVPGGINNKNASHFEQALSNFGLESHDADALTKYMRGWLSPTETEPFVKGFDTFQNLFKAYSYSAWPASHARNLVSALYNNWIHGANFDDARAALQAIRQGKVEPGLSKLYPGLAGLTPEQAASNLIGRSYAHGKVFSGINPSQDILGHGFGASGTPGQILPSLPGTGLAGTSGSLAADTFGLLGEGIKGLGTKEGRNPFGVAGAFGHTEDTNSIIKTGRKLGGNIEDFVRLQSYLGNIRKGLDDAAAGRLTRKVHFDYSDMTPFEKNVMRRLVPFYTFARKNLPFQVEQLIRHPSNIGVPLKLADNVNRGSYIPEYLQNDLSFKVGNEENGTQRFVSSLGLPFEEFGHIKMNGGLPNVGKTLMNYMGTMTPLIKGPLEQLFDTQFHTGRKLSDLHPTGIGSAFGHLSEDKAQLLSQFLANTPLTRAVSTIDKLADERKGITPKALNLLSGFKLSDVNMEKLRAIDAREVLSEMLGNNPAVSQFTNFYVKPENQAKLSPNDIMQLQLFAAYKAKAKAAVEKEKAKQIGIRN